VSSLTDGAFLAVGTSPGEQFAYDDDDDVTSKTVNYSTSVSALEGLHVSYTFNYDDSQASMSVPTYSSGGRGGPGDGWLIRALIYGNNGTCQADRTASRSVQETPGFSRHRNGEREASEREMDGTQERLVRWFARRWWLASVVGALLGVGCIVASIVEGAHGTWLSPLFTAACCFGTLGAGSLANRLRRRLQADDHADAEGRIEPKLHRYGAKGIRRRRGETLRHRRR
jgi:hypothetical protein